MQNLRTAGRNAKLFDRALKARQRKHAIKQDEFMNTAYLHERTAMLLADRVADIRK